MKWSYRMARGGSRLVWLGLALLLTALLAHQQGWVWLSPEWSAWVFASPIQEVYEWTWATVLDLASTMTRTLCFTCPSWTTQQTGPTKAFRWPCFFCFWGHSHSRSPPSC